MANKPNNPALWSRAKSMAKQKFDVYPSAYANGWAAKWYKSKGGTWRKAEYGMQVPMMEEGGKPDWLLEAQLKAQGFSGNALQQKMSSMAQGGEPQNAGFQALPDYVQAKILSNMGYGGMTYPYMQQGGEPDGGMALGQIAAVVDKMSKLAQFIRPESDLEPWVSSKLAVMDHYADAVSDYMNYNPEAQGEEAQMPEMRNGGYTVTRSNDRKGKTHKVTGPDGTVKYFGDSKLGQHPKDPERKKAFYARHKKNLDANPYFRAFARATWKDGGTTFSGNAWYGNGGAYTMLPFAQEGMQAEAVPPPPMAYEYPDHGSYQSALQMWTSMYGDPSAYDYSQVAPMPDSLPAVPVVAPGAAPVAATVSSAAPKLNPYDGASIYDFMKAQGKSPDYQSRKSLANALGVSGYRGTADQNMELMEMIRENPAILLNYTGQGKNAYVPTQGQKSLPGKAKASENIVAQENQVAPPEVQQAIDTIATITKNLPDSTKKKSSSSTKKTSAENSELGNILKAIGFGVAAGGGLAAATYLTVDDIVEVMYMVNNNEFDVPPAMKGKLLESLEVLRNNALQSGTSGVKRVMESYYGPEESVARLRGRLTQNIANRTNSALAAIDAEDEYVRAMEETQAAAKARRVENARKASQARWSKVKGAQPTGTTAQTAAASALENTATAMANTDEAIDMARVADGTADLVPAGSRLSNMNAAARNFFAQNRVGRNVAGMTRTIAQETPWIRWARTNVPKALKFLKSFEEGGSAYLPSYQTQGQVKIKDIIQSSKTPEQAQAEFEEGEANDSEPWWLELVDPTGYTSWDDFDRMRKNPNSGFFDYLFGTASLIPLFGKVGKAGKIFDVIGDASKLSKTQKAVNTGKKVVNATVRTADALSGAPIVRVMDKMNPYTHATGYAANALFKNSPKVLSMFQIANDINRGTRGVNAMTGISDQYFRNINNKKDGYVSVPVGNGNETVNISDSDSIGLILPNGSRLNTTWSDPRVAEFWKNGLMDTTASGAFIDTFGGRQMPVYKIKNKKQYGGMPCYECGGNIYQRGGQPETIADKSVGKFCGVQKGINKELAAANAAAGRDAVLWAKQAERNEKILAKEEAAKLAGQLNFDYDWMGSAVDKPEKKAAMAAYKQFLQDNPSTFVADDTSGYNPEQKYLIASKLKQKISTPVFGKNFQQQYGVDPRTIDLQRLQREMAPRMGGWEGMRNYLFNRKNGGPVVGQEMDVTPEQLEMLKAQGYQFEII